MNISMVDVINRRQHTGMSDEQRRHEWALQDGMNQAVNALARAISDINKGSAVVKVNDRAFWDFVCDELPAAAHWNEKIAEARNG